MKLVQVSPFGKVLEGRLVLGLFISIEDKGDSSGRFM